MQYDPKEIEAKWRRKWKQSGVYQATDQAERPKYYVLDMFPYPSGAGLHVGHPLGYIASDIVARYKRHQGYNVLHPMGYDSFGLPAEQYAIQTGQHPAITTEANIARYREQLDRIGLSYDWSREVRTSDPAFYKWTQWIFLQLFDSWYDHEQDKARPIADLIARFEQNGWNDLDPCAVAGNEEEKPLAAFSADGWNAFDERTQREVLMRFRLAYLGEAWVNWCAALGTVLANDEVKDGASERGGHPVERKRMPQWSMRITAYAQRLLDDLETLEWSASIKELQRNWVGKSEGAVVRFQIKDDLTPNPTPKEQLWQQLRGRANGGGFHRQYAIDKYIVDLISLPKRLIIEIDEEVPRDVQPEDAARTKRLKELGFHVIRFTSQEVMGEMPRVVGTIQATLAARPNVSKEEHSSLRLAKAGHEGCSVHIEVFTTRPDTLFGVTFITLAPEHELVERITSAPRRVEVMAYVAAAKNRSERERLAEVKRVSGVFTGAYCIHPFTGEEVPVWVGDYVLGGYGTGAVMAVPGADERDRNFAVHFGLPIIAVTEGADVALGADERKDATISSEGLLKGLKVVDAIPRAIDELVKLGCGARRINFRLRDAAFGRQRYWGEPIPIYYKNGVPYPLPETELPLELPEVDQFLPTGTGDPPLARAANWNYQGHPLETTTMPGWAGSSWYFLRYMDPHNAKHFASAEAVNYWQQVDLYVGGSEHATGHLLYFRFWTKFLCDRGWINFHEPAKKLVNQGMVQGVSMMAKVRVDRSAGNDRYILLTKDEQAAEGVMDRNYPIDHVTFKDGKYWIDEEGAQRTRAAEATFRDFYLEQPTAELTPVVEKMSKSKFNVVNPDGIIEKYGADTLRLYEMFLGPIEQSKPWDTNGIEGTYRFLRKFWNLFHDANGVFEVSEEHPAKTEFKVLHATLKKVTEDIEKMNFNTSVAQFMIAVNELSTLKCNKRAVLDKLVVALAPFAPHVAEELWEALGHSTSVTLAPWPEWDAAHLVEENFSYPISFNGKTRLQLELPMAMDAKGIERAVLGNPDVQSRLEGKPPKKVIVVPKRIVNIVV
jgi:leucyl-tRNA synthetase